MIKKPKDYTFIVVVEKDEDGYFAYCPELQGCYTQGDSYDEVMENIKDAIKLHVADRLTSREDVPSCEVVSLSAVKVAV